MKLGFSASTINTSSSTDGGHGRKTELEAHGQTKDGWHFNGGVRELEGLLPVEVRRTTKLEVVDNVFNLEQLLHLLNVPLALHAVTEVEINETTRLFVHFAFHNIMEELGYKTGLK